MVMNLDNSSPDLKLPSPKRTCTWEGYKFQLQHYKIFDFLFFLTHQTSASDNLTRKVAALIENLGYDEYSDLLVNIKSNPELSSKKLSSFSTYQSQMMMIRLIDNFNCYLSDILQITLKKQPDALKSNETVKVEDILKFNNHSDLVNFLINRKLNNLAYGGLREVEQFISSRFNIELFENENERENMILAYEIRNINTHNRGIVNEIFLSRIGNMDHQFQFETGKRFHTGFDEITVFANNILEIGNRLDVSIAKKYNIKRKWFRTWDKPRKLKVASGLGEPDV